MKKLLLILPLFVVMTSYAQVVPDKTKTPTHLCYATSATSGKVACERFDAPNLKFLSDEQFKIFESPVEATRLLNMLPTFALAAYHHWVFSITTIRAQLRFADCVGGIKALQRILGVSPLIDAPGSPAREQILGVREYIIPFNAIAINHPKRMPTKQDAIDHAIAGVKSTNVGVDHVTACRQTLAWYENEVQKLLAK